ncbi:hypothetical protein JCM5296_003741 [Sporobolomyces johnsonii]
MPPQSTELTLISFTLPASTSTTRRLSLPFPPFSSGSWTLTFAVTPAAQVPNIHIPTLSLEWSGCELGVEVQGGTLGYMRKGEGGVRVNKGLSEGRFPPTKDGSLKATDYQPFPRDEKTVEVEFQLKVVQKEEKDTAASRTFGLLDGPRSLDVCLVFPRDSRKLWASSRALGGVSPYWTTQLASSGFCEEVDYKKEPVETTATLDDSDDELDDNPSSSPRTLADSPPPPPGTRTIPITGTTYKTYHAFLCWLYTGQLQFAPLTSTFLPPPSSEADLPNSTSSSAPSSSSALLSARRTRRYALSLIALRYPLSPPAVSPKSLYRLAHFLEIPALQSLCVTALRERLTVDNIPREMLGSLAESYQEIWDVEVKWAKERWKEVLKGEGMRAEEARMKREGATGHEVATLLRLYGV